MEIIGTFSSYEMFVVLNFDPSLKCCKRMGHSGPLAIVFMGRLELGIYCGNVYGKISAAPLIILSSVYCNTLMFSYVPPQR